MNIKPYVAIIIVNWNGLRLLKKCIPSVCEISYPISKYKVIVVDNGSTDSSVNWLKKNFPNIDIITSENNLGFAKANNIGIKKAFKNIKTDYIVTLNNDTSVEKNWLLKMIAFMEKNNKTGIATGKILNFYNRSLIDSTGDFVVRDTLRVVNRGKNEKDTGQYDKPCEVFSACAASAIYRKKTLQDISINGEFFDEDFENYIEDVDLSIRARLLGWKISYIPNAVIFHMGSATSSKISKEYKEFVSRRNRLWYAVKNFPLPLTLKLLWKYILPSDIGLTHYFKYSMKKLIFLFKKNEKSQSIIRSNQLSVSEVMLVHIRAVFYAVIHGKKMIIKRKKIQRKRKASDEEIHNWFMNLSI